MAVQLKIVFASYWHYIGTIFASYWHYIGTILALYWHYIGTILALLGRNGSTIPAITIAPLWVPQYVRAVGISHGISRVCCFISGVFGTAKALF